MEGLLDTVRNLAQVRIEYASGSYMIKAPATFCAFRPRSKDVQVTFILDRVVEEFPVAKHRQLSKQRTAHALFVEAPDGIDAQLVGWLQEAHGLCLTKASK